MKGKRFEPIPEAQGLLTPPPRKPPIALATAAPVPPRRGRGEEAGVARSRRRRRTPRVVRKMGAALEGAIRSLALSLGHTVRS